MPGTEAITAFDPKAVEHRIEKQSFNACVLRWGGSPFVGMRRSGGGKQRVVLSEESRERQQIRDMAVVLSTDQPGRSVSRCGAHPRR